MDLVKFEVAIFKALAHPLRIDILKTLGNGECCVCEINDDACFSQSNVSQHLRILKDADLVVQRKEGLKVFYRIKDQRVLKLIEVADELIKSNINAMSEALKD